MNGPNLNLLGKRPTHATVKKLLPLSRRLRQVAGEFGLTFAFTSQNRDTDHRRITRPRKVAVVALVINPAAVTHTSVESHAGNTFEPPIIEVQISRNVHKREEFSPHSYDPFAPTA